MLRIASLISSATEIVCALGMRQHLVGISHECDYPADIKGLPVLSAPKLNPNARGADIDREVRRYASAGLSIYHIYADKLEELAPDLILTQDQCEVCAVSLRDVENAVCTTTHRPTKICSLRPNSLDDIRADFRKVGAATGAETQAEELVRAFDKRLEAVRHQVDGARPRPRILLLEWLEPLIVAGGWMPEIARIAGFEPVIVDTIAPFKKVSWDEARAADPDVVVILPCGYPMDKTMSELVDETNDGQLRQLRAFREKRCYIADGNAYFNRPGPRIADSCEILAALGDGREAGRWAQEYRNGFSRWAR